MRHVFLVISQPPSEARLSLLLYQVALSLWMSIDTIGVEGHTTPPGVPPDISPSGIARARTRDHIRKDQRLSMDGKHSQMVLAGIQIFDREWSRRKSQRDAIGTALEAGMDPCDLNSGQTHGKVFRKGGRACPCNQHHPGNHGYQSHVQSPARTML